MDKYFLDYSTTKITKTLLSEIEQALRSVSPYGSLEIFVQDNVVTQITVRKIKKTSSTKKTNSSTK